MDYKAWMFSEIKRICTDYKARTAGSEAARAASDDLAAQMNAWADTIKKQDFTLHPHANLGSIVIAAACGSGSALSLLAHLFTGYRLYAALSFAFSSLALLSLVLEYTLYRQPLVFALPKAVGQNVYAVRKSASQVQKRVILCGHIDAAYEMSLALKKGWSAYGSILLAIYGLLSGFIFSLAALFCTLTPTWRILFTVSELVALSALVTFLRFVKRKVVADGANDNLTGCP